MATNGSRSLPDASADRPHHSHVGSTPKASKRESVWTILAVLAYTVLALFSWIVVAVQSFHPINRDSYGWGNLTTSYIHNEDNSFAQNDNYYRASRIITVILALVTVPLVLFICSRSKGAYIKRTRQNMWQAMAIMDNRNGLPLWGTISLCALGCVVYILQLILVTAPSTYTPNAVDVVFAVQPRIVDIISGLDGGPVLEGSTDVVEIAALLKSSISTASSRDTVPTLWKTNSTCEPSYSDSGIYTDARAEYCYADGISLFNVTSSQFVSNVRYGRNTGLVSQFAPRINSSVTYETVDFFPICNGPNTWYRRYQNTSIDQFEGESFEVEICMPDTSAALKNVHARQDIGEALYLKFTVNSDRFTLPSSGLNSTWRVIANTTSGYFELPNYMNGQQPGDLISGSPIEACGIACYDQYPSGAEEFPTGAYSIGPLFRLTRALFGNDSLLDTLAKNPLGYTIPNLNSTQDYDDDTYRLLNTCLYYVPMARLLRDKSITEYPRCIYYFSKPLNIALEWITMFTQDAEDIRSTFAAMMALSNNIWLNSRLDGIGMGFAEDYGTQHLKPTIALPSLIIISILLAIFLISLMVVTILSCLTRPTNTLSSLFMVQLGARNYRRLGGSDPAVVTAALKDIPGWIDERKFTITDDMELN